MLAAVIPQRVPATATKHTQDIPLLLIMFTSSCFFSLLSLRMEIIFWNMVGNILAVRPCVWVPNMAECTEYSWMRTHWMVWRHTDVWACFGLPSNALPSWRQHVSTGGWGWDVYSTRLAINKVIFIPLIDAIPFWRIDVQVCSQHDCVRGGGRCLSPRSGKTRLKKL